MRGKYGELTSYPTWVSDLINELDGVAWTTGISSDRKQRGESINVDCYGYDEKQMVAVVQVRQCRFRPGRFNHVRKDYFIIGHNENGNPFAHPVESVARAAKNSCTYNNLEAVEKALCKVWQCTPCQLQRIVRNGDVAFIPQRNNIPFTETPDARFVELAESHLLEGDCYYVNGNLYVRGRASIAHTKGQHPQAVITKGVWRVAVGYRAKTWNFSAPTAD